MFRSYANTFNIYTTLASFYTHAGLPIELKEQSVRIQICIIVAPYAVLELVVTSTDAASLITNHMHVADF